MFKHLLCEFDGTLVDSSAGILESLRTCIDRAGVSMLISPSASLIGPPLATMMAMVIGTGHESASLIEAAFRSEYDERGYLMTRVYPGIEVALRDLREEGVWLHIVTNKRLAPVRKTLDELKWGGMFVSVNTLDTTQNAVSKGAVLARLVDRLGDPVTSMLMVGDSQYDGIAAAANAIEFAWASWGYGQEPRFPTEGIRLNDPEDLVRYVRARD